MSGHLIGRETVECHSEIEITRIHYICTEVQNQNNCVMKEGAHLAVECFRTRAVEGSLCKKKEKKMIIKICRDNIPLLFLFSTIIAYRWGRGTCPERRTRAQCPPQE